MHSYPTVFGAEIISRQLISAVFRLNNAQRFCGDNHDPVSSWRRAGVLYDLHVTTRRTLCVNCAHLRTSRGEYDEHTVTNTTRRSHQQTHRLTFLLPLSVGFDLLGLTGL